MRRAAVIQGLVIFGLLLPGCGGRPPPTAPPPLPEDMDEDARLSIAGIELPRMPIDVTPEDEELAPGWQLAERALTMPTPRPPNGAAWEVEVWADEELAAWMSRRAEAVAAVQRALEPARAGHAEYSVVASMLLGLVYSRFALDLRGVAVPDAFAADPVRAEAFRNALATATGPLWQRALDAYGSCASTASEEPAHSLDQWRERCDAEGREAEAMLPDPPPRRPREPERRRE